MTTDERKVLIQYAYNMCGMNKCEYCPYDDNHECTLSNKEFEVLCDKDLKQCCDKFRQGNELIKAKPHGVEYLLYHNFCHMSDQEACINCPFNRIDQYTEEELDSLSPEECNEIFRLDCTALDLLFEDAINGEELNEEDIKTIEDVVAIIKKEVGGSPDEKDV